MLEKDVNLIMIPKEVIRVIQSRRLKTLVSVVVIQKDNLNRA